MGLVLAVISAVVSLDQITKWWALEALGSARVIELVWTLRLRLVFNTGAAFGRFENLGPLLGVAAGVVVIGLLISPRLAEGRTESFAVGCIAGGALGNLSDRLFRSETGLLGGAVIDFIDVQWWPVWNVADMAIVTGATVLICCSWYRQHCGKCG